MADGKFLNPARPPWDILLGSHTKKKGLWLGFDNTPCIGCYMRCCQEKPEAPLCLCNRRDTAGQQKWDWEHWLRALLYKLGPVT